MSDLYLPWTTGKTLDLYLINGTNQRYRFDTHVFENFNAANWASYAGTAGSGMTEQAGSGDYFGNLPTTGVTAGTYSAVVRERQDTGNPAVITDPVVGGPAAMAYSGSAWSPAGGSSGGAVGINEVSVGVIER